MQRRHIVLAIAFLNCVPSSAVAQTAVNPQLEQSEIAQRVRSLVEANSIDLSGRSPFHIKISFDLYDLDGQRKETGSIDDWWVGPKTSKIAITGPSLDAISPGSEAPFNRETYLAQQLLRSIVRPIGNQFTQPRLALNLMSRTDGATRLDCVALQPSVSKPPTPPAQICTEPSSNTLLLQSGDGDFVIHRDGFKSFHGASVPSDVSISYLGRPAIVGNVTLLEDIDGNSDQENLPARFLYGDGVIDATVLTGLKLTSKTPVFPKAAKKAHQHGSVTLIAVITKQGTIRNLDVIATPAPSFSQSAIDAVQTWTYQPFLLNGQPTEVETTINVNYNLGGHN